MGLTDNSPLEPGVPATEIERRGEQRQAISVLVR